MRNKVFIKDGLLIIHEGDNYYDFRTSYEVKTLTKLVEDVGVRGGHVGWSLHTKDGEHSMGRKIRPIMEKVKSLIEKGELDIEYEVRNNMEQRCF